MTNTNYDFEKVRSQLDANRILLNMHHQIIAESELLPWYAIRLKIRLLKSSGKILRIMKLLLDDNTAILLGLKND